MQPHRYDGSSGPYADLLARLSTAGAEQKGQRDTADMGGWRDPFPFMSRGQSDAHLIDLQRMAARDEPALHEADKLDHGLGYHAITGANSTMHGLHSRQQALEIIAARAEWLSTYLTQERLDEAIQWRDQMERRAVVARRVGEQASHARQCETDINCRILRAYKDRKGARKAWDELLFDAGPGGMEAVARQVEENPALLGELRGGRTWLGLGGENEERLNAREEIANLSGPARQYQQFRRRVDSLQRDYENMDKPPRAEGRLAETLAAMRDIGRLDLHYLAATAQKVVQARALIAGQHDDPLRTVEVAADLYQKWHGSDDLAQRITATQLKRGIESAVIRVRRDEALSAKAEALGLNMSNPLTDGPTKAPKDEPRPSRSVRPAPGNAPAP
ncbi:MAG: hypothetical protein AAF556_06540 [Pseudomonadota bacterium]